MNYTWYQNDYLCGYSIDKATSWWLAPSRSNSDWWTWVWSTPTLAVFTVVGCWQISEKKQQAFVGCTDTSYRERFYPLCIVYIHQTDCYVYLEVNSNSMAKVWTCHKSWPIVGGKSKCGCLQAWNKAETTPDLLGGQNALKSCERVLVLR